MRLALTFLLAPLGQVTADQVPPALATPAETPPPQAALKYHAALLLAPHNATLFGRFYDAWLDEQALDPLASFLSARAENGKAADLSILARFQLRRGLDDDAFATLGKALAARPDDHALLLERARISLARLDFTAARKDLETATATPDPALSIEAGTLTGKSHLREGNPAEATAAWEKLIAKHPGNTDILEDLVELNASSDQPDQAIAYCRRLIEATADAFRKTQHKLRLGELLAESGKSTEALALWTETLSQTGEGSWLEREIIDRIATSFRRQDRIDALSAKLAELAAANPRRLLIHRELAKLEAAEGEIDSAIGRFREVLRRSPGDAVLREEFIRLLIDGQRFGDAAAELEKMIALSPENPDLHLRMADLTNRRAEADPDRANGSPPPPEVLAALEKALSLMPPGEPSGIRIAGLMLTYGFNARGEELLAKLASAPGAGTSPAEALAAEYARTGRKKEALEILTGVAKSPDLDVVLRASSSIASLGDPDAPFAILNSRQGDFPNQPSFLAALAKASLAANKPDEAIEPAIRLVRLAALPQEILDATRLAASVIAASEKTDALIESLSARNDRPPSETCLLASLLETKSDPATTDALFKDTTDPALLRFHASLLSRRGDPLAAIAALKLLPGNSAARPDFLKELAELQLRAGLADESLATLGEWKTAAPTAREPWVISARLLRDAGRYAEAIETTRGALTRFPGDEDFSSTLADLHQISGDHTEAERLFWKLYDKAPDPSGQSRWAARLSMLARQTGATAELAEKFTARARGNSRSTGPVLALVELARASGDREAIRNHLARALFIKPGDIDIRIQLAEAEANAGNPQAQIDVLSEGIAKDPAGRLRTALAQAYISGGDVMKGMRLLRALSGERASDPRSAENVVTSLHAKGHVPEAIQYLREALPDGGDWRTKFLLALMLREDGREPEAIPVLLSLLAEETEIANLPQNNTFGFHVHLSHYQQSLPSQQDTPLAGLMQLSQAAQTASRVSDRRQGPISQYLPTAAAQLRAHALIQLATIASSGNTPAADAITAANPPGLAFAIDLIDTYKNGNPDFIPLVEKHPQQPGLLDMVWMNGTFQQGIEKRIPLLKRILATSEPSANIHFQLLATLIRLEPDEPEHWDQLLAVASKAARSDDATETSPVIQQLLVFVMGASKDITPERMASMKELLLGYATKSPQPPEFDHIRLSILAHAGTRAQWIAAVNAAVAAHRSAPKPAPGHGLLNPYVHYSHWQSRHQPFYFNPGSFGLPYSSIPPGLTNHITLEKSKSAPGSNPVTAEELLTRLDQLDSPLLRAYVAVLADDEKAIAETLSAPHPDAEATDFEILRASREISAGRLADACRIYVKLRESSPAKSQLGRMADSSLVSTAMKMTPEQREEFEQALRAALTAMIPPPGPYHDASAIIHMANHFGFTDMVKSLAPAQAGRNPALSGSSPARIGLPAAITPPSPRRPTQQSSSPIDRFREFARGEKNAAAAREFLRWVGDANRSGNSIDYITQEAEKSMTPAIRAEILALSDPGSTPGLTKRRAHIDICLALGEREKALAALSALAEERPFDPSVTIDLAFLLPPGEIGRATSLLVRAAGAPQLADSINSAYNRARQSGSKAQVIAFFQLVTAYLEDPASAKTSPNELNRMTSLARDLFSGGIVGGMQTLLKKDRPDEKQPAADAADIALARRLALAMLRHPVIAETGFSLLNSAEWEEKPADLDEWARSAILLTAALGNESRHYSSSNPFPQKSPIRYLLGRIADTSPDLLPAAFLDALTGHDPHLPALLRFHSTPATTESINALWGSGAMESSGNPSVQTLQESAFKRTAATPGASRFFLSQIRKANQDDKPDTTVQDPFGNPASARIQLLRGALETCSSLDEKGVNEICSAIIASLFPYNQDDDGTNKQQQAINTLRNVFGNFSTDLTTSARIIRAFDSSSIPIPPNWMESSLRSLPAAEPAQAVESFSSMGLLADAASWKPFAINFTQIDYNGATYESTRTRTQQLDLIAKYLNSSRRKELATLLESRKPRTFGSLITAASLASGSERERLAAEAFKLAAPTLKKANAGRLDDFALLLPLLPHSATATLPPQLRDLALKSRAEKAAALAKTAKQQIDQANQNLQNPLGNIQSHIAQLAPLDLTKSVEIFLEATEIHLSSAGRFANQGNSHEDVLDSILRSLASSDNPDPETALRFYQAILASPSGPRFGISRNGNNDPFLSIIGEAIGSKAGSSGSWESSMARKAWIAAAKMPAELRIDALAAVACQSINRGNHVRSAELNSLFSGITDADLRAFAFAVTPLRSWQNEKAEARAETAKALTALLARPDLSAHARSQIALHAACSHPNILSDPAIAEAVADIFAEHCARDASAVSYITLGIVARIGTDPIPPETLPHLKRINDAFWKNANSPLPGGHPPISEQHTAPLCHAAMAVGDAVTAKRLFAIIQPGIVGNLDTIATMLSAGQFDFAAALLPDDSNTFTGNVQRIRYTEEFHQRILDFRKTDVNPAHLLRLECALLRMRDPAGGDPTSSFTAARRQDIAASYAKTPPSSRLAKSEILAAIATSTIPSDKTLAADIDAFAATLDPAKAVDAWTNDGARIGSLYSPYPEWDILCKSAANTFVSGDSSAMVSLFRALGSRAGKPFDGDAGHRLSQLHLRMLGYIVPATCHAIAAKKTAGFDALVQPLADLAVAISGMPVIQRNQVTTQLALCEFIAAWQGQPEVLPETLAKIKLNARDHEIIFGFPRKHRPFLRMLGEDRSLPGDEIKYGLRDKEFLLALLSHPPIADLLPAGSYSELSEFGEHGLGEEILAIATGPLEAYPPAGRAILAFHAAKRGDDHPTGQRIKYYQACLENMPAGKAWDHMRGVAKCHLALCLIRYPERTEEGRKVFDTLLPEEIPADFKSIPVSIRKMLAEKAEK